MTDTPDNEGRPIQPPVSTRYQKGQSGNPHGRPRGSRNRQKIAEEEANQLIFVTENGRRQKITKWHAAYKQQVNKAVGGDLAAFKVVDETLDRLSKGRAAAAPATGEEQPLSAEPMTDEEAARIYMDEAKKGKSDG